jgi:hypothetical protein
MSLKPCRECGEQVSDLASACPKCGAPTTAAVRRSKSLGCTGLLVVTVVLLIIVSVVSAIVTPPPPAFDAFQPQTITRIIDAGAHPTATFENGTLTLPYSIDPWALSTSSAKTTFLFQATKFFPTAFQAPLVVYACVEGTGTLVDIRGNKTQATVMSLCMSRNNAAQVQWNNVNSDNLPEIADSSFIHPSFAKSK